MGEKRQSSKFLKRCIEDQLFLMMEHTPYSEIDVRSLCDRACVGRTSFYRYFKNLDDVILYAFARMWEDWCETHGVRIRDEFSLDNAVTFFEYNLSIKNRLILIYGNGLESILLKSFELLMKDRNVHNYESRFYAYGLFAMLKEWYLRNFAETPEELAVIMREVIENHQK